VNPSSQSATELDPPCRSLSTCHSSPATLRATPEHILQGLEHRAGMGQAAKDNRVEGVGVGWA